MDVLSDVIAVMRTGEPRSSRVEWYAPWGQRFMPVRGAAGFQVILQGSCWLVPVDGAPFALGVGDVVFMPHGRGHVLADSPTTPAAEPGCDPRDGSRFERRHHAPPVGRIRPDGAATVTLCGAYQLDPARAHPLLGDLPDLIHLPARPGHLPEIRGAVELLGAELVNPWPADAVVRALLDMLLLYILRAWFADQPGRGPVTGWTAALNDPAISAALSSLHGDPAYPWTVETLGARAGLSRAAFSRRFTGLVGQPPLTYLTWWRMTTAARLLVDTDAPLGVVAAQVGYTSEFAFANAFKRRYGTAPGRYRRGPREGGSMAGGHDRTAGAPGSGREAAE
ncbi:AraC family transcriptional regulator [Actinomadura scrupuli]|uniref:AraC family transcriptional regulator n=1 Tax=Actinomadura scrupuli TaxID=559629 RepID=UPI003D96F380